MKIATEKQERELLAWIIRMFPYGKVPADTVQYLIEHPEQLPSALQLMIATSKPTRWQELLDACQQDWIHSDFTEARWPLEPVADDEDEWKVTEYHFTKGVATLNEGLHRLKKLAETGKFRLLAGSRRVMEWLASHPDVQLDYPVVLPLCARNSDGRWVVPVFFRRGFSWKDGKGRDLGLFNPKHVAYLDCRWLVLCRKAKAKIS